LGQISELTGQPVLIGDFHFGTPGRGMAARLVQVPDQAARGRAYRYYGENAFAMPELVGTHYFRWADQPCTGPRARRRGDRVESGPSDGWNLEGIGTQRHSRYAPRLV